jgi:nucleoside-diphosphate-sugar epimerase
VEAPTKSVNSFVAAIGARAHGISEDEISFLTSDRIVSIEKIKKDIGFRPQVNLDAKARTMAKKFLGKDK